MGRVIAAGENKSVQSSETGTILNLNVSKGDQIQAGDIIASINPTEALGLLNELNARQSSIEIQIKRLDSEINGNPADNLKKELTASRILKPILCRLFISLGPGFPRPTSSNIFNYFFSGCFFSGA